MISIVNTITVDGLNAVQTEIQISIYSGMPSFNIVGMAGKSINEAALRIRAALNNIGLDLPPRRIVVHLSPADIHKDGNYYDLPIVVGILRELEILRNDNHEKYIIVGELALNSNITKVSVALVAAMYATANNFFVMCPNENGPLAMISGNKKVIAPKHLWQLINHLNETEELQQPSMIKLKTEENYEYDFANIRGQYHVKRGLELAAAGGHSIILKGPPGCGKTFSIQCLASIMPRLSNEDIVDICLIESITNNNNKDEIKIKRPFRSPHHSASPISIIGGGKNIVPGEITLAHKGILFFDELAEFHPGTLDALREPLESGTINISRVNKHIEYPADFQLVGAMNPCKCGYFGNKVKQCNKIPDCASSYQKKLSGPFLDRIDILINISNEDNSAHSFSKQSLENLEKNSQFTKYKNSALIRERIEIAREVQYKRYQNYSFKLNAKAIGDLESLLNINQESNDFLKTYCEQNNLSVRSYNKIIKLARTIADLSNEDSINKSHILEAMYFRLPNVN